MLKKLYNQKSKDLLIKRLDSEDFERMTCSFYKYFKIDDPTSLRDEIYSIFDSLEILGRIYIASEGINAQISVPEKNWKSFLKKIKLFVDVPIKTAIKDGLSFLKLIVKVKKEIVAYGIPKNQYDMNLVGEHLNTEDFNKAMEQNNTTIIDLSLIHI